MNCKVFVVCLIVLIALGDSSSARHLPNRRGRNEREVTREANLDISVADTASKNPKVDNFITELANLSIPHYLKDIYLNFSSSSGELGMKANTIRSYENTAKSEFYNVIKRDLSSSIIINRVLSLSHSYRRR